MTGSGPDPIRGGCTVTVCRDCCCGSTTKHPEVDHDAQFRALERALSPPHQVRASRCLDRCTQSNVIVVHPTPQARRGGARPVWFGLVVDDQVTTDIADWVQAGGPGHAPLSDLLALSVITAPTP